jgi:Na+-transporting methylmalonyl-CoA/oxaloacetate decarboxylase beta subunit
LLFFESWSRLHFRDWLLFFGLGGVEDFVFVLLSPMGAKVLIGTCFDFIVFIPCMKLKILHRRGRKRAVNRGSANDSRTRRRASAK